MWSNKPSNCHKQTINFAHLLIGVTPLCLDTLWSTSGKNKLVPDAISYLRLIINIVKLLFQQGSWINHAGSRMIIKEVWTQITIDLVLAHVCRLEQLWTLDSLMQASRSAEFSFARKLSSVVRGLTGSMLRKLAAFLALGVTLSCYVGFSCCLTTVIVFSVYLLTGGHKFALVVCRTIRRDLK